MNTYSAARDRRWLHDGHRRPGPQRGRPRGPDGRRARAEGPRRAGAPRPGPGRRPHRRAARVDGRDRGPAAPTASSRRTRPHYLRGRSMADLEHHLRTGLARAGVADVESYETELEGLQALVPERRRRRRGLRSCATPSATRSHAWLAAHGGTGPTLPRTIRRKVVAARGSTSRGRHRRAVGPPGRRGAHPCGRGAACRRPRATPRLTFELRRALDAAGRRGRGDPLYARRSTRGLREPHRHRARIQLGSSLRAVGQGRRGLRLLVGLAAERPHSVAVTAFRALVQPTAAAPGEAVADLVDALVHHAGDEDTLSLPAGPARLRRGAAQPLTGPLQLTYAAGLGPAAHVTSCRCGRSGRLAGLELLLGGRRRLVAGALGLGLELGGVEVGVADDRAPGVGAGLGAAGSAARARRAPARAGRRR